MSFYNPTKSTDGRSTQGARASIAIDIDPVFREYSDLTTRTVNFHKRYTKYTVSAGSVLYLLMHRLLTLPENQQLRYWLCESDRSFFSLMVDLAICNIEKKFNKFLLNMLKGSLNEWCIQCLVGVSWRTDISQTTCSKCFKGFLPIDKRWLHTKET